MKQVLDLLVSIDGVTENFITHFNSPILLFFIKYRGPSINLKEIITGTLLIEKGIRLDVKDEEKGSNAPYSLCGSYFGPDFSDIVTLLCSNGIDVNDLTNDGHDVFFMRCHRYDYKIPSFKDMETLISLGLAVRAIGKRNDENLLSLLGRVANHNSR